MFLDFLFKVKKQPQEKSLFWINENQVNKLPLLSAIKRIDKRNKNDLIFDPVGYDEWKYLSINDIKKLKLLIFNKYYPKRQIILSMPKENYTFRPVAYLTPSDSIIYQAIVDKLIMYKKDKFSNQVYSNIINNIENDNVFNNPVNNWLRMRNNLREQYDKGNNFYFSADISGYFENIKIDYLISLVTFHIGYKEKELEPLLKKILMKWQFANAQGLVQPHNASSILAKIYLTPIDSALSELHGKYSRYVDEFHIISYTEKEVLKSIYILCEKLRELGLNLNSSKSRFITHKDILKELTVDQDFFNLIGYIEYYLEDDILTQEKANEKFNEFVIDFESDKNVNMRVFRRCLRIFEDNKNPKAIEFCLKMIYKNYSQTVDIVKYLSVFIENKAYSKHILGNISNYIESKELNNYQWVQCWLLNLYIKTNYSDHVNKVLLKNIFLNKNQNCLSRATALLAFAKHSSDFDLIFLKEIYRIENNILLKRAILAACSKMPRTFTDEIYRIEENDELDIIIIKEYLQKNDYKIEMRI